MLFRSNPKVTLMRTTPEENTRIGEVLASKCNLATGPLTVLFPRRAISVISAPGQPFHDAAADTASRLVMLFDGITAILELHRPDAAAVEETFVNKNPASTLKLGLARGIALLVPAQAGLVVGEYAANSIKKSVVGVGHAAKEQIQMMVQRLLPGVTLYGQGGYIDLREGDEDLENTYFGRAAVRWFPEPNLKVAGEFDYVRGRLHDDIGNKVRVISWGGSVEKRFTGSMFSMFLNYNGMDMRSKSNPDDRAKDHTVVVGLRIFGNTSTLYANDRAGATYDSPNFLRYLPWVGEAD